MTEFPRLLRSGSPLQRALLEAARPDAPSAASQERLLLAVRSAAVSMGSVAAGVSSVGSSSSPTASASLPISPVSGMGESAASAGVPSLAAPVASALTAPATAVGPGLFAKWLLMATLSLSAVGVGVVIGRGIAQNSPIRQKAVADGNAVSAQVASYSHEWQSESAPRATGTANVDRAAPTLPLPPPNNELGTSATEVQARQSGLLRPGTNRPVAASRLSLGEEIALVEKAREALRGGDPAACLSVLELHRKGVRGGVLTPEATILRIDALRALGQRARASREAARFVHDYPESPLVEHVRELLTTTEP